MVTTPTPSYFLPGFEATSARDTALSFDLEADAVTLHIPVLTPVDLEAVVRRLLEAQTRLARYPIGDIIDVIDQAVQRWLDPDDAYRQQAETLLPVITRYSPPMIRHGLDTLLHTFRKPNLWRLLWAELGGSPGARHLSAPPGRRQCHTRLWTAVDHAHFFRQCPGPVGLESHLCAVDQKR
jgi:hypothetical protein